MDKIKKKYQKLVDEIEQKQIKHERDTTINNMDVEFSIMALDTACNKSKPLTDFQKLFYNKHYNFLRETLNKLEAKHEIS